MTNRYYINTEYLLGILALRAITLVLTQVRITTNSTGSERSQRQRSYDKDKAEDTASRKRNAHVFVPDETRKNPGVGLTVLVVADEVAVGVGGEGGLAGAGQAEEEGGVAFLSLVGRAVHGHHAVQRQPVVHHGEDALLHLTSVPIVVFRCWGDGGKTKHAAHFPRLTNRIGCLSFFPRFIRTESGVLARTDTVMTPPTVLTQYQQPIPNTHKKYDVANCGIAYRSRNHKQKKNRFGVIGPPKASAFGGAHYGY